MSDKTIFSVSARVYWWPFSVYFLLLVFHCYFCNLAYTSPSTSVAVSRRVPLSPYPFACFRLTYICHCTIFHSHNISLPVLISSYFLPKPLREVVQIICCLRASVNMPLSLCAFVRLTDSEWHLFISRLVQQIRQKATLYAPHSRV